MASIDPKRCLLLFGALNVALSKSAAAIAALG